MALPDLGGKGVDDGSRLKWNGFSAFEQIMPRLIPQ